MSSPSVLAGVAIASMLVGFTGLQSAWGFTNAKLNGPLSAIDGDVASFQISPDGTRVVYLADQDTNGVNELYSRPIDGSGAPVKLNVSSGRRVETGFLISPDSTHVVYRAAQDTPGRVELYSRPIDGSGASVKLNGTLLGLSAVLPQFFFTPDGTHVVYLAAQDAPGVVELYSRPIDGSGSPVKLNGPLVGGGDVQGFLISPDGMRVVYRADQEVRRRFELYSRSIDGSGTAVKINVTSGRQVEVEFLISPDSSRVVYRAAQDTNGVFELYSRPIDGSGTAVKLNGTLVSGGDVQSQFLISPDGTRVVYLADQDKDNSIELYSRPIDGSGTPVKLNGILVIGGNVQSDFLISANSSRVVYRADQDKNGVNELYSRPIDGSGVAVKLNGTLPALGNVSSFQLTADSARAVYIANQDFVLLHELYSRPIDGSGIPVKLDIDTYMLEGVKMFALSADGSQAVYAADQDTTEVLELYRRAVDGSGSPVKLNGSLVSFGNVATDFAISSDGARVVYRADEDALGVFEVFSRPFDGSGSVAKLNGTLAIGGSVEDFLISPDGSRVVYRANQDTEAVEELYSRPADGSGTVVKLNGPMTTGGSVERGFDDFNALPFLISPDGTRVVYYADQDTYCIHEIYSRPIDGSGVPIKLNHVLPPGGCASSEVTSYLISPDSAWVVYRAPSADGATTEVFSRRIDGSGSVLTLSGPLPAERVVTEWYVITPDSTRVLYAANRDAEDVFDLYVRPIDGSGSPIKLSGAQAAGGFVDVFRVSADGTRVVYDADTTGTNVWELYSRLLDGSGTPVKLNGPLVSGGNVLSDFVISPDGAWVVYHADQETDEKYELYSCPIAGSATAAKLNGDLASGGGISDMNILYGGFLISPDGTRVVYRANQEDTPPFELYSRPIDGSGVPTRLSHAQEKQAEVENLTAISSIPTLFLINPAGTRVVFVEDSAGNSTISLYTRPIDGSGEITQLSDSVTKIYDFRISPDGARVVYSADEGGDGTVALYSRPIDGSGAPLKQSGTATPPGGQVSIFDLSPDGMRAVYIANQEVAGNRELWSSIRCGDGIQDPGEQCDDGNIAPGDCCSPLCLNEPNGSPCSDGNVCTVDACTDGVCSSTAAMCGDGVVSLACGEACDDGGAVDGGCDANCQLDPKGRACLRAIGLQARRMAVKDLTLTQQCLNRVAVGTLGCQANQCVLNPAAATRTIVPGSACTTGADCCPEFDRTNPNQTTAAKGQTFAVGAAKRVLQACSLARGPDGLKGTDDDTYVAPQTLGFGSTCPGTFGQCAGVPISQLHASGSNNDLIECTQCAAAASSNGLLKFHYPLQGSAAPEITCQRAIGLQTRTLANRETTLRQQCLDRVAKGVLRCQTNQCVLAPPGSSPVVVPGSSCSVAADCCPAYDQLDSTKTTQAQISSAEAIRQQAIRQACSIANGADHVKGTADDTYVDPQSLGYGGQCLATVGQCGAMAIPKLTQSGDANDLLDCVACSVGGTTQQYTRFHSGAP